MFHILNLVADKKVAPFIEIGKSALDLSERGAQECGFGDRGICLMTSEIEEITHTPLFTSSLFLLLLSVSSCTSLPPLQY